MGWTPKDLEQLIPYMLAVYLLLDVAKIKENNSLLILPPIGKSNSKTFSFIFRKLHKALNTSLILKVTYLLLKIIGLFNPISAEECFKIIW